MGFKKRKNREVWLPVASLVRGTRVGLVGKSLSAAALTDVVYWSTLLAAADVGWFYTQGRCPDVGWFYM